MPTARPRSSIVRRRRTSCRSCATRSGRMLAGTESPGRLYRFDANDKPFVLLDSGLDRAARRSRNGDDGAIFAAALSRGDDASSASENRSAVAPRSRRVTTASHVDQRGSATLHHQAAGRRSFASTRAARGNPFWDAPDVIYDIAVQGRRQPARGQRTRRTPVHDSAGPPGVPATRASTRSRSRGSSGRRPARTGGDGHGESRPRRSRSAPRAQSPASYVSPVRDTKSASTWGTIRWEAAGAVALYSRGPATRKSRTTRGATGPARTRTRRRCDPESRRRDFCSGRPC